MIYIILVCNVDQDIKLFVYVFIECLSLVDGRDGRDRIRRPTHCNG
jgi:hypothetical protein